MNQEHLNKLRTQLRELMESVEFAYAMGSGCAMNTAQVPEHMDVIERYHYLVAQIQEHAG